MTLSAGDGRILLVMMGFAGRAGLALLAPAVLTAGCGSAAHKADAPGGCTTPNEGPPANVRLARDQPAHVDLLLSKYLIVVAAKSPVVRDLRADNRSPLAPKGQNGAGYRVFEAVRLGSTQLTQGKAVALVKVVCHLS